MSDSSNHEFDVFVSYATNPDYSLARNLESFLETFHKLPNPENISLIPLRACVDGSDFHTSARSGGGDDVGKTIESYLARSKELLVLCSRNARQSTWVDQEIKWFLANRGSGAIRLALTEGEDLSHLDEIFPQAVLDAGLHKRIAYDFRGVHKRARQKWQSVRDFDDERTRLAADLYDKPASEIRPIWFREQRRLARNRTRIFITVTMVLLALLILTVYFYFIAEARRKQAFAEAERTRRQFYVASLNLAHRAWNEGSVTLAQQLLEEQNPRQGQEDLRDFDWSHLWRRTQAEKSQFFVKGVAFESVSVSSDGLLVAAGGRRWSPQNGDEDPSHYVYVWSLQTGELKYTLAEHDESVKAVKFSPTAPVLVSGSESGTLKVWSVESGLEIYSADLGSVDSLAFSPDGGTLAVADGAQIDLFNTTTWESMGQLVSYPDQELLALAFSPDGKFLAVGGMQKQVHLWDMTKRKKVEILGEHKGRVTSAAWSTESNQLATGGEDGEVILWDITKKRNPVHLPQGDGAYSLAFARGGKLLAVGLGKPTEIEGGKAIVLWDVPTGTQRGLLRGHPRRIMSLDFTPTGDSLVSVGEEENVRAWDIAKASYLTYFEGHGSPVWAFAFSPDGKTLASGDGDGAIRLWLLQPGGLSAFVQAHQKRVSDLSFDPTGRLLASVGWDDTVRLWEPASKTAPRLLLQTGHGLTSVAFSPDGTKLAAAHCDGTIYVWEGPDFKALPSLKQSGCLTFLAWSPDSRLLVAGGGSPATPESPRSISLWRIGDTSPLKVLNGHSSWPSCVAFSPNSKNLVTGDWDGEVILWDLASGTMSQRMRGHTDLVTGVSFSPSGKIIASSSRDKTVRIWDTITGQERATLTESEQELFALKFHPKGDMLAAGGSDGSIVLWLSDASPLVTISPQR
ncbi:MAG TPA: TIR domain-containing protein [Blastocatellia bacterium]|nr:TIR domain-containing protein [Blastocatellia bacterium]